MKKLDIVKMHAANGNWHEAIKVAAKFPRLGDEKKAITRAKDCILNPRFYESMGFDVEAEIQSGIFALRSKYGI